jgi:FMN-dependent NADH-azoreductase
VTVLLRVDCSITRNDSVSRRLTDHFVRHWRHRHPNTKIEILDLADEALPHFGYDNLQGISRPPDQQTAAMRSANALSDRLISQVERADIVVIGCPMYNFTAPTQLKSWLDYITRVGRTFKYTGPNQAEGLLGGRKVLILEARGGEYSAPPSATWDFQEPLLRHWFRFLGMNEVHFVRAEGLKIDPALVPAILKRAEDQVIQLLEDELFVDLSVKKPF